MSEELKPCPFCKREAQQTASSGLVSCAFENCPAFLLAVPADDWSRRAQPAEAEGVELVPFWVLFDATTPEPLIKKHMPEGVLAFFDNEEDARRAKALHPGTDYKRAPYVRAAALSAVTAERDRIKADREACWEELKRFRRTADETERELRAEVEGLRKREALLEKLLSSAANYATKLEPMSAKLLNAIDAAIAAKDRP